MNTGWEKVFLCKKQLIVQGFFYFKDITTQIWPNIRLDVFMTANRWVNEVSNGHTCRQAEGPNHQDVGGLEWLQNKQTHVIPARHKHQTKNSYPMA